MGEKHKHALSHNEEVCGRRDADLKRRGRWEGRGRFQLERSAGERLSGKSESLSENRPGTRHSDNNATQWSGTKGREEKCFPPKPVERKQNGQERHLDKLNCPLN